jgi:hypothetical protein
MKKLLVTIIILLVAVLMVLTAPDEQKHKDAMMAAVREFVDQEAQDRGFKENVLTKLGKSAVNQAVKTALNAKLKFNNYYLFNTTHVRLDGENQLLSFGIFGQVITFDKEMLKEKLEEATRTKEVEKIQKEAAKDEAKALKKQLKEERKRQKQLEKEKKRQEKEAKRKAKEAAKEAKRKAKELNS